MFLATRLYKWDNPWQPLGLLAIAQWHRNTCLNCSLPKIKLDEPRSLLFLFWKTSSCERYSRCMFLFLSCHLFLFRFLAFLLFVFFFCRVVPVDFFFLNYCVLSFHSWYSGVSCFYFRSNLFYLFFNAFLRCDLSNGSSTHKVWANLFGLLPRHKPYPAFDSDICRPTFICRTISAGSTLLWGHYGTPYVEGKSTLVSGLTHVALI